jgi:hypothetical protein
MEEGAFDHLEGSGQPLALDDNPFEDAADRMAYRLLKNNGFAPAWLEDARDIDAECAALLKDVSRGRITRDNVAPRIAELNRRIERFNLAVPLKGQQKLLIRLHDLLAE